MPLRGTFPDSGASPTKLGAGGSLMLPAPESPVLTKRNRT